jgi:predicted DNA-binding transcriptional regulator AlpA
VATCHNRGESGDDTHLSPAITQQITAAPHFNSKTAATNRPPIDPIFLAHEVCAHMRIGRTTLHKIVKSGELVPLRVGARVRAWRLSAIEAYLASKEAK